MPILNRVSLLAFSPADIKHIIAGRTSQVFVIAALHVEMVLLCMHVQSLLVNVRWIPESKTSPVIVPQVLSKPT